MTACPSHNRMGTRSEDDAVPMPPPDGDLQSVATIENHAPSVAHGSDLPPSPSQTHVTDMPPFWSTNRHNRAISSASYQSLNQNRPQAIILEDHSEEDHELAQACWAKSVTVDDYSVVSGPTGVGAYVVWHCTVCTLKGGDVEINKRCVPPPHLCCMLLSSYHVVDIPSSTSSGVHW